MNNYFVSDLDLVECVRYEDIISLMSSRRRPEDIEIPPPIPPKGLSHLASFESGHNEDNQD